MSGIDSAKSAASGKRGGEQLSTKSGQQMNQYKIWDQDHHVLYDEPAVRDHDMQSFIVRVNLLDNRLSEIKSDKTGWEAIAKPLRNALDYYLNYEQRATGLALLAEAEAQLRRRLMSSNVLKFFLGQSFGTLGSALLIWLAVAPALPARVISSQEVVATVFFCCTRQLRERKVAFQ